MDTQRAKRGYSERSPLHWACRNGHMNVVAWLVEDQRVDVNAPSGDGTTALCLAVWQGRVEVVTYLISQCAADPHLVNGYGCNLAMWCAQSPGVQRENNPDFEAAAVANSAGVVNSLITTTFELAQYLHDFGVNFTLINHNGQGCLHKAAQRGHEQMCKWLVQKIGLEPLHFKPNSGEQSTPSTLAKYAGHDRLAEWLLAEEKLR
jgi:ankyrin repeat protein